MNADDPKFTAHVLGESEDLTPAERAEIEALLAGDPAAATEAAETRALAVRLRAELSGEAAAPLAEHQRAAVMEAAKTPASTKKIVHFPRRVTLLAILAACVVVGISLGLVYQALQMPAPVSVPPVAVASSEQENFHADVARLTVAESPPPVQLLATNAPAVPPHPALQMATGAFQSATGILNTAAITPIAPHLEGSVTTNTNTFTGTTVLSTGVISVNGGVTTVSSSTITTFNVDIGRVAVQGPSAASSRGGTLAFGIDTLTGGNNLSRWENQTGIEADPAGFQLQDRGVIPLPVPTGVSTRRRGGLSSMGGTETDRSDTGSFNTSAFDAGSENDFLAVRDNPLSTFSVDVDTASYAIVRRMLANNQLPPKGAVRTEELLNYFTYDYPQPSGDAPFSATMEVAACPWEPEHRLVRVGLKGREVPRDQRPPSNIVFLIDVSGSMNVPNKLPLLQQAFRLLIEQLGPKDRVAIVTYAGSTGIVLEPTQDKEAMQAAVDRLRAGGSTNGASGVQLAYQVAEKSFIRGGTNRVILATDGDWNVGVTSQSDLLDMIAQKAKGGVFLTVLGFGMDNLKDSMLVKLADRGNGHYAYIDTPLEAKKVFVEQLSGTLVTIAKDVKIQVEFNPARVGAYRLIGYEKRLLAKEDFNNDKKDAGEIGAGHTVTALYEVVPAGKEMPPVAMVDKLKYAASAPQPISGAIPADNPVATAAPAPTTGEAIRSAPEKPAMERPQVADGIAADLHPSPLHRESAPEKKDDLVSDPRGLPASMRNEMLTLKLRYKAPDGDKSALLEYPLTDPGTTWEKSSPDFRFAAAVAGYGMLLRDSGHRGQATWESVAEWAHEGLGSDKSGYREEFLNLVKRAKALTR